MAKLGRGLTALALEELVGFRVAEREARDVGVHGEREPVRPVLRRVGQDCGGDDLLLLGGAGLRLQQVRREATNAVHCVVRWTTQRCGRPALGTSSVRGAAVRATIWYLYCT